MSKVYRWSQVQYMNDCRALKAENGGSYQAQTAVHAPDPAKGSWERLAQLTASRWSVAAMEAVEAFRFTVHGGAEQWEGL